MKKNKEIIIERRISGFPGLGNNVLVKKYNKNNIELKCELKKINSGLQHYGLVKSIRKNPKKYLKSVIYIIKGMKNIKDKIEILKIFSKFKTRTSDKTYSKLRAVKHNVPKDSYCYVCKNNKADCMHHVQLLINGGSNSKKNLLPICNSCHEEIHSWLKIKRQNDELDKEFERLVNSD